VTLRPMLACFSPGALVLALAPIANCAVMFVGGTICCVLGNKAVGTWVMAGSALVAAVLFLEWMP
jgi:hypothetical protein